ncbi:MAG: hypothetical protein IJ448_04625, partial [Oscillospiraceae bacterium]|nr:hypothetical protein [Oscillospiraceae bacterium]
GSTKIVKTYNCGHIIGVRSLGWSAQHDANCRTVGLGHRDSVDAGGTGAYFTDFCKIPRFFSPSDPAGRNLCRFFTLPEYFFFPGDALLREKCYNGTDLYRRGSMPCPNKSTSLPMAFSPP